MTGASVPHNAPDKLGLVLRVGFFVVIGWIGMAFIPVLLLPVTGLLAASALSVFAAAAIANAIVVRVYERGRLSDLGLGWSPSSGRQFFTGAGLGAGGALVIVAAPLALGLARFTPAPGVEHRWAALAFVSITLLFGAAGEEMLFHGYAFQLLIRSLGSFATILPAGVLFGLAHAGNQNATAVGVFNTMIWGVLLGFAYLRTQALWMPIGLHFGWNAILPLFGVNLSGFTMGVTGYSLTWRVGAGEAWARQFTWWSGGDYGPEGGVAATLVAAAVFVFVLRRAPERSEGREA
jgi:membrane protease YdiL (CAAX protease family)